MFPASGYQQEEAGIEQRAQDYTQSFLPTETEIANQKLTG
jgi:hypothetical protein